MARPTHTSQGGVGGLTTATKKIILKLGDGNNNDINNLLHDEDMTKFLKSHTKGQAKSSAEHILGDLYNNIYHALQPEQPPRSHAEKPTISIEKMHSMRV